MRRWTFVACAVGLLMAACGSDEAVETESTAAVEATTAAVDCRSDLEHSEEFQLGFEPDGPDEVAVTCDLAYKTAPSGADQTLDVYVPAGTGAGEALPAVIFFHFVGNDITFYPANPEEPIALDWKLGFDQAARVVASRGMAGITFNYRSFPMRADYGTVSEENLGLAVEDAMDLLAYVADHAADLNVDPSKICVWTNSTGSLVGAYSALAGNPQPVCAVVFTGPLSEDFAGRYDPVDLVTADMPPFFIARAGQDTMSNDSIDRFSRLAGEAGAEVTVERVAAGHGFEVLQPDLPATGETLAKALEFVMQHLGLGS